MESKDTDLLKSVAAYYSHKLAEHGSTPKGVDWNGNDSQNTRFEQLTKLLPPGATHLNLSDLGCGYGALFDYLKVRFDVERYLGMDVSAEMIEAAKILHQDEANVSFIAASEPKEATDYCVASGIFNVRLEHSDNAWFTYLQDTLDTMDRNSRLGFGFNCLTSYSDEDKKRDYLYYADPCKLFDICKRRYSKQVALLHDYGLYEFTILVRKTQ